MATKKSIRQKKVIDKESANGTPKFPYTIKPNSLRRFLEIVPNKPKPTKVVGSTLKVWGFKDSNDQTILRVLKVLNLLSSSGETTEDYAAFMSKTTGAESLGLRIKSVYGGLFENISEPYKASNEELKNFFNIHSGGGEKTIRAQIDTFKALCEHATFNDLISVPVRDSQHIKDLKTDNNSRLSEPAIRIDLHIHLPENGSKTDYESIIESIAKHLYGRNNE